MNLFGYLVGALCGGGLLAMGLLLGLWLARRWGWFAARQPSAEMAEQFVRGLYEWTNSVVGDVDQCRERMEAIRRNFDAIGSAPDTPAIFVQLVADMADANRHMQQRLVVAEEALAKQANKISEYVNEARTDALTGLPNRRMFDEELARRFAEWQRYGVAFTLLILDIDRFKQLNDTHGHITGDDVLRHVARTLGHTLRETDLLARYGGEEFAALLTLTAATDGRVAAERSRTAVAQSTFYHNGLPITVTVSCGLAEPRADEQPVDLLRRADQALYASKKNGRNCSHWHDGRSIARITPGDPFDEPTPAGAAAQETPGLSEMCDALRRRLVEITSG